MANVMLKDLPSTSTVLDSDEFIVWNGTGNARRANRSAIVGFIEEVISSMRAGFYEGTNIALNAHEGKQVLIPYSIPEGYTLVCVLNAFTSYPNIRVEDCSYDVENSAVKVYATNMADVPQNIRILGHVLLRKTLR